MAVSSTGKQGDDEPESGDDSSDEDEELGEEQEMGEKEVKKPNLSTCPPPLISGFFIVKSWKF